MGICSSSLIACPPGKDASRRDAPPLFRVDETLREVADDGDLSGFGVSELRSLLLVALGGCVIGETPESILGVCWGSSLELQPPPRPGSGF